MSEPNSGTESPVFICGTSRSGTSLVADCLREQSGICVVPETHYFDDLRVRLRDHVGRRLAPEERRLCEDYFLALSHRPYGHQGDPELGTLAREDLREAAGALGGCPDAHFTAYCTLFMKRHGGRSWGEKTPRHVFRIDEMLEVFPSARVIYMLRDPRGVVASYRDWRNQGGFDIESDPDHARALEEEAERTRRSYHPVIISLLWKAGLRAARSALAAHGPDRVRIETYEGLCSDPDGVFAEIFGWLGSDRRPDSSLLAVQNSSYDRYAERSGVQSAPSTRWRTRLSSREIGLVERVCGGTLEEAGYERLSPRVSRLVLLLDLATTAPAVFKALRANATRSGNLLGYLARRIRLACR